RPFYPQTRPLLKRNPVFFRSPKTENSRLAAPAQENSAKHVLFNSANFILAKGETIMKKVLTPLGFGAALVILGIALVCSWRSASASAGQKEQPEDDYPLPRVIDDRFQVEVLVNGRPVSEYAARGRRYIEALEGAEYEVRIHNPLSTRVAVALSVDGLNTIDARHTNAWDAHKWVIEAYGTIEIGGWQMSS